MPGKTVLAANKATNWNGVRYCVLIALLLASALLGAVRLPGDGGPRRTSTQQAPALQQALHELAIRSPDASLRVIVQAQSEQSTLAHLIDDLGGTVIRDLHILRAFAAELPAGAVTELAAHPAVRWISLDAPVGSSRKPPKRGHTEKSPLNTYLETLNVLQVWDMGITGTGIGVAIIDSGISKSKGFSEDGNKRSSRIVARKTFNAKSPSTSDVYGHGTHVAGIVAGNGSDSDGLYAGMAPDANLINLKISDRNGMAYESDTVAAMQWVYDNKDRYNIRVVNLSINSSAESSYHESPMNAAAEILWFNGVVVVVSSGNKTSTFNTTRAAPANDPFMITVGATKERQTADRSDDDLADFSAHGTTLDGHDKPEIVAPGENIVSILSKHSRWDKRYPEWVAGKGKYFKLSGTSMAAPMVAGAAALLLQDEPNLTPDQVKYRLLQTASAFDSDGKAYGYLDVFAAVTGTTTESANTGLVASQLLWSGDEAVMWESVNWNSVNWNSVNWNSVNWNSVNWNSAVILDAAPVGAAADSDGVTWTVPAWPDNASAIDGEENVQLNNTIFLPMLTR